jgi:site-specific recombinase
MSESEVARLRKRLEQEYEAARWGLSGLAAGAAQHRFITARLRNMERCHKRLAQLVGEEQATEIALEVWRKK